MDDSKIIELFFQRSENAIGELSQKYGKLCRFTANNILGNLEDSEECVNDAYLGVWNAVPPKKPDNLPAFLLKIVRNLSVNRLKYNAAEKRRATTQSVSKSSRGAFLQRTRRKPNATRMSLLRI